MITNNPKYLKQVGRILNIKIPEKVKHLWNDLQSVPIQKRMRVLSKKYYHDAAILIFSEIEHGIYKPRVFKTDYKLMKSVATTNRDCIFFFASDDYIRIYKGKIVKQVGTGYARFVSEMMTPRHNPVEAEFNQYFGDVRPYQKLYKTNKQFVERIEYIFSNLQLNHNLIYEIMRPKAIDVFIFKLMYVLYVIDIKDTEFLREFKGNPDERHQGIDPSFEAQTLLKYMNSYTDFKIELDDIYKEVIDISMDEQFIQLSHDQHGENAPD